MLDGIPIGAISDGIGTVGIVLIVGFLLATRRLVTRGEVERTEAAHAREIARMQADHEREMERMQADHEREMERMQADHEREMGDATHDRDEWRAESRVKDQQIAERDSQLQLLAEVGRTVEHTMGAIQAKALGKGESP